VSQECPAWPGYDANRLREDFRFALLSLLLMPVLEALQLEERIARRAEMSGLATRSLDAQLRQAMRNEERLLAAIIDNAALDLVPL
jgi:hypothetical protein